MMNVSDAIKARASTRAFLNKPVAKETIEAVLETARWAASGKNTQPWHVAVVTDVTKNKISTAILQAFRDGIPAHPHYDYYSKTTPSEFHARAIACGMALYQALGIERSDKVRRKEVWEWNYQFFGAPVGLFIFMDKNLALGSWIDIGMFLQNIMLTALDYGLATCPQAALTEYPDIVQSILGEPYQDKLLICGISLGYPDLTQAVNQYRTSREAVETFTQWYA